MTTLDVTAFIEGYEMFDFSHSAAEGGQNAGDATWRAALAASDDDAASFIDDENRDAFNAWCGEWGAWSEDEIAAWSHREANALLLQFIAGDWRTSYEKLAEGEEPDFSHEGGALTRSDDGTWHFYMGH